MSQSTSQVFRLMLLLEINFLLMSFALLVCHLFSFHSEITHLRCSKQHVKTFIYSDVQMKCEAWGRPQPHTTANNVGNITSRIQQQLFSNGRTIWEVDLKMAFLNPENLVPDYCISSYNKYNSRKLCITISFLCRPPPMLAHGNVKVGNLSELNATAQYRCDTGYYLNGEIERTCWSDAGIWAGDDPTCEGKPIWGVPVLSYSMS